VVLVIGGNDLGHFGYAGDAAGRPEVDQSDLAFVVSGRFLGAIEQHKAGFRRGADT
jgi:hypothetical protein